MSFKEIPYKLEFSLTLITLLCSYAFFPMVYDESYDSFCNMQVAGQFSDFSLMDQYYLAWVGFNEVYKFLHNSWPAINWTGIAFILFNSLGLFLVLSSLKRLFFSLKVPNFYGFVLQIVVSIIYIDNIISITHTRFSILFCGLAILNFGLLKNMTRKEYFFYLLVFIIGVLHRPESGLGLFVLMGAALVIVRVHQVFNTIKRFVLPALFLIILYGFFMTDWLQTDLYERKLEPNIEYALTTKRILPIDSMTNAEDSLRYEMATQGMFIDEDFVSIEFLRRITAVEMEFNVLKFKKSFIELLNWYAYYAYFPILIFLMLILAILYRARFAFWVKFVFVNLLFFIFMNYISYGTNIAPRHVSGLLVLNTVCIVYLFFTYIKLRDSQKFWGYGLAFVLLLSALHTLQNYKHRYEEVYNEVLCYQRAMNQIEQLYQGEYAIVTLFNYHLFDQEFKVINELRDKNTYLMYDIVYYSKVPPFNAYLAKICNCDPKDPIAFFSWMEERKAVYIIEPKRLDLTQRYLAEIMQSALYLEIEELPYPAPACFDSIHANEFVFSRIVNKLN